jgi:hypothetical protein
MQISTNPIVFVVDFERLCSQMETKTQARTQCRARARQRERQKNVHLFRDRKIIIL